MSAVIADVISVVLHDVVTVDVASWSGTFPTSRRSRRPSFGSGVIIVGGKPSIVDSIFVAPRVGDPSRVRSAVGAEVGFQLHSIVAVGRMGELTARRASSS